MNFNCQLCFYLHFPRFATTAVLRIMRALLSDTFEFAYKSPFFISKKR